MGVAQDIFDRLRGAARKRVETVVDRFLPAQQAEPLPPEPPQLIRIALGDGQGIVESATNALAGTTGKRPPTDEYGDLPINAWAAWTLATAQNAVRAFATGSFGQAALLTESMLADDRIQAAVNGRTKGITRCEARFTPIDAPGGEEAAKELDALYETIVPDEIIESLMVWTIFMGFALAEIIWEPNKELSRWVPRLKVWHPLTIYYNIGIRRYVAITTEGPIEIEPGDPKWLLYTPFGAYRGWMRGAVRSVPIPWMVRQYALRDMARFSEKHGLPMVVAKMPYQSAAEDKARFMAALRTLGSDTTMALPIQGGPDAASWDVMLLEAKDKAWEAFPRLRDICDQSITLSIRGTNLTTEVDGGSYAAAQAHRDEDADFAQAERKKIAMALRTQLFRHYCVFNFGDENLTPAFALVPPETQLEPKELAEVWNQASAAVTSLEAKGWPVDRVQVAARFGIPIKPGAELKLEDDDRPALQLTPSDTASIVTVNEARAAQGMDPLQTPDGKDDPDGDLTIAQFVAKRQASVEQGAEERPEEEIDKKTPAALQPFAKPGGVPIEDPDAEPSEPVEKPKKDEEEDEEKPEEDTGKAFVKAFTRAMERLGQEKSMTIEEAFSKLRVAIAGGPHTGKTTLAAKLANGRELLSTDDYIKGMNGRACVEFDAVPDQALFDLAGKDSFVIEGTQVARCLRKGLAVDVVVVLEEPFGELTSGQQSQAKGCRTVLEEWLDTMASVPVLMPAREDVESVKSAGTSGA